MLSHGGRIFKDNNDKSRIEDKIKNLDNDLRLLGEEFENRVNELDLLFKIENYPIETISVKPKKSDINISLVALVWRRA